MEPADHFKRHVVFDGLIFFLTPWSAISSTGVHENIYKEYILWSGLPGGQKS